MCVGDEFRVLEFSESRIVPSAMDSEFSESRIVPSAMDSEFSESRIVPSAMDSFRVL